MCTGERELKEKATEYLYWKAEAGPEWDRKGASWKEAGMWGMGTKESGMAHMH